MGSLERTSDSERASQPASSLPKLVPLWPAEQHALLEGRKRELVPWLEKAGGGDGFRNRDNES